MKRFDFGVNWKNFSEKSLDQSRFNTAIFSLDKLIGGKVIKGKSFLDIGCGSGIFSLVGFFRKSILDEDYNSLGEFDIVYSWGVLHHTGKMWKAIGNALELVNDNGYFVIAIYNKQRSSPLWRLIKYTYNWSPKVIKKLMILIFYWIIALAKFLLTGKNPFSCC